MALGIGKIGNEYVALIEKHIDAPKAVWMAIAVSLANQLDGGSLDRGMVPTDTLLAEWQALHDNGIVPQVPRGRSIHVRRLSLKELDAATIRTGCETALNRAADAEMKRRGYYFNPTEQKWMPHAAPVQE